MADLEEVGGGQRHSLRQSHPAAAPPSPEGSVSLGRQGWGTEREFVGTRITRQSCSLLQDLHPSQGPSLASLLLPHWAEVPKAASWNLTPHRSSTLASSPALHSACSSTPSPKPSMLPNPVTTYLLSPSAALEQRHYAPIIKGLFTYFFCGQPSLLVILLFPWTFLLVELG